MTTESSNALHLAKTYLESRALSTLKKPVRTMINSGCLYSVLPTNEVISVLELAINGELEEFVNQSRLEG